MYSQKYLSEKIWAGEYLGRFGALAIAEDRYDESGRNKEETFNYVMTLYSAIGNFVAQLKKFRFWFVPFLLFAVFNFRRVMNEILYKKYHEDATPERKEVLMAYLLLLNKMSISSKYVLMAMEIGEELIFDEDVSQSVFLLAVARLHTLKKANTRSVFKKIVHSEIRQESTQKDVGWKTINRLARLIGDNEMIAKSASLAESQDVLVKSGVSV
jgi:histone H3/H4